jgi:hypothetical protein
MRDTRTAEYAGLAPTTVRPSRAAPASTHKVRSEASASVSSPRIETRVFARHIVRLGLGQMITPQELTADLLRRTVMEMLASPRPSRPDEVQRRAGAHELLYARGLPTTGVSIAWKLVWFVGSSPHDSLTFVEPTKDKRRME